MFNTDDMLGTNSGRRVNFVSAKIKLLPRKYKIVAASLPNLLPHTLYDHTPTAKPFQNNFCQIGCFILTRANFMAWKKPLTMKNALNQD